MIRTRTRRPDTERGTTLVEMVIGLFLVAMAAGLLAQLMASTGRSRSDDTVTPDLALAVDTFSRDVREAVHVEAETRAGRLEAITLVAGSERVRWHLDGDQLLRDDFSAPAPRTMAVELDDTSRFVLGGSGDDVVDPSDADAVRWCTRLVEIALAVDGEVTTRATALRIGTDTAACP